MAIERRSLVAAVFCAVEAGALAVKDSSVAATIVYSPVCDGVAVVVDPQANMDKSKIIDPKNFLMIPVFLQ
jgi:hypothetical protein